MKYIVVTARWPLNFVSMFDDAAKKGVAIIGMKNVLSDAEAREKLLASGVLDKFK